MRSAQKLHTLDKHTHGFVSTFITAVVLAVLLVGAIISTELSQKNIQSVSRAQVTNPDNAACAASCQTQSLNGVTFMGGECLGLCVDPRSEFTNTQFTCQGSSACCCYLPASTCNSDCVTAGYTNGSCQPGSVVQGGAICSTGGTSIYSAGCNATEACCCIFTGATATPTSTPIITPTTGAGTLNCSITMPAPPHTGGASYSMQATVTGAANNFLSYNWQVVSGSNNALAYGTVTNSTAAIATWTAPTNAALGTIGVVRLTVRDASNAITTCQFGVQVSPQTLTPTVSTAPPTATLTPIATPATACGQSCYRNGGGDDGYCSSTATTCPNGGNRDQTFDCMANRNACCCVYYTPTPTPTTSPTATITTAPPTITPAGCDASGNCIYGYFCVNNLCVTGTPTPTFTGVPSKPPSPTCFNPKQPIWSPGVTRNGDTLTIAWDNQTDGLKSKVEVCTNGGGTCQVVFDGTSPASNSIQKTITGISTKDIIVQMTSTNTLCGTTSDLSSQYLAANASVGVNVAPTIAYSNGTPAWLIAGAAFIVVLLITVAIVAM